MCRKCVFWRCRSTSWSWSWRWSWGRSCYSYCSCSVFGFRFGLTVTVTVTVFWLCRVLCVAPLIVQLHKYLNCVPPRNFFVLLAGLYFDSYRFAAPHDAARDDDVAVDGALSCQALAIHFLKYAWLDGMWKGWKPSGASLHWQRAVKLACLCLRLRHRPRLYCLPHSTHLQYVRVMRHKPLQLALISFFSAS